LKLLGCRKMKNYRFLTIDPRNVSDQIQEFIAQQVKSSNKNGVVLGLSGGLDSTVVAYLAEKALGNQKVTGLILPERDSSLESGKDAIMVAEKLKIKHKIMPLTQTLRTLGCYSSLPAKLLRTKFLTNLLYGLFQKTSGKYPFIENLKGSDLKQMNQAIAFYRMKHRLRMVVLYFYAESENLLVLGCANKSEHQTGFFVRYGDDSGDILPILHLYKSQVCQLGDYLKIPNKILRKPPTPDLLPGLKDEKLLRISYNELDPILYLIQKDTPPEKISETLHIPLKKVEYVIEIIQASQNIRETPYSFRE
jgi:NAD+ synthase